MSTTPNAVTNNSRAPKVVLDEMAYQKIMHWVNKSNYEVSGLGKVVVEDGIVRILDAILLPQKNSHTTTDIEGADVGKAAYLLRDTPGELQFWWHSHVNMGVFWSGTDLDTIKVLAQGGWFVSTVFNKRNETKTCIAMNDPFPIMYDNIQLTIERMLDADLVASWDKEYDEKVTNVVPKSVPSHGNQRFPRHNQQSSSHAYWNRQVEKERSRVTGVFSREEQAELARLAQLMTDEDPVVTDDGLEFGLGRDGVYGDLDSPYSSTSELGKKIENVNDVLTRRDKLEIKIEAMEARVADYQSGEQQIPTRLARALEVAQEELDEVEDELDVLRAHGMLNDEDEDDKRNLMGE